MNKRTLLVAACLLFGLGTTPATIAQDTRAYKEGNVVDISYIKVKPGKFNEYMAYLAGPYKKVMEENKKAGLIVSWAIYGNRARNPQDPDLYLTITYPNWAALDRVEEAMAISARVSG
ncbi:MAG TPA: hypothetical protein VFD95_01285, partial [Usitatibacter sp.]|nr:hypothetical protein [Usitatibacter sp.]